jgi:hypothetical protein
MGVRTRLESSVDASGTGAPRRGAPPSSDAGVPRVRRRSGHLLGAE